VSEHNPLDLVRASDIPLPPLHMQIAAGIVEMTVYIDRVGSEPPLTHRQRNVLRERIAAGLLQYAEAKKRIEESEA
jgi:hypothetical protein